MAHLSSAIIEQIKERVSLSDLMDRRLHLHNLKRNGGDNTYTACCPFHDDKSPSLSIDDNLGLFNCFGCGATGDVIDVLLGEGMPFPKALAELCSLSGLNYKQLVADANEIANIPNLSRDYTKNVRLFTQELFTKFSGYQQDGAPLTSTKLNVHPTEQQSIYNLIETSQMFTFSSIADVVNQIRTNEALVEGAKASGVLVDDKFSLNTKKMHVPLYKVDLPLDCDNPLPYCTKGKQIKQIECAGFYVFDDSLSPSSVYPKSVSADHSALLLPTLKQIDFITSFTNVYLVESPDEYFDLVKMGIKNVIAPATTNQINVNHLRQIASLPIEKITWVTTRTSLETEHNISRLTVFSESLTSNKTLNVLLLNPNTSLSAIFRKHGQKAMDKLEEKAFSFIDIYRSCIRTYSQMSDNSANIAKHSVHSTIKRLLENGRTDEATSIADSFSRASEKSLLDVLCSSLKIDQKSLLAHIDKLGNIAHIDYQAIEYALSNEHKLALFHSYSKLTDQTDSLVKLICKGNLSLKAACLSLNPHLNSLSPGNELEQSIQLTQ